MTSTGAESSVNSGSHAGHNHNAVTTNTNATPVPTSSQSTTDGERTPEQRVDAACRAMRLTLAHLPSTARCATCDGHGFIDDPLDGGVCGSCGGSGRRQPDVYLATIDRLTDTILAAIADIDAHRPAQTPGWVAELRDRLERTVVF